MNIELKGRKAIVTGSTAGIGRAIAEGLARAGSAVVVNGRTEERVAGTLRELRALLPDADLTGIAADLATAEGSAALAAQAPDADILVNNVGTARPNGFFEQDDAAWLDLFQLNVMSGVRAARHYMPGMVERGWGRVVFISSESALAIPKEMIDYGMTKTALLAVSRAGRTCRWHRRHGQRCPAGADRLRDSRRLDEGHREGAGHHANGRRA